MSLSMGPWQLSGSGKRAPGVEPAPGCTCRCKSAHVRQVRQVLWHARRGGWGLPLWYVAALLALLRSTLASLAAQVACRVRSTVGTRHNARDRHSVSLVSCTLRRRCTVFTGPDTADGTGLLELEHVRARPPV